MKTKDELELHIHRTQSGKKEVYAYLNDKCLVFGELYLYYTSRQICKKIKDRFGLKKVKSSVVWI